MSSFSSVTLTSGAIGYAPVFNGGVVATREVEARVTNRPMVVPSRSIAVLRRGWLHRASPIAAKSPPLLAAMLPWDRDGDDLTMVQVAQERGPEEKGRRAEIVVPKTDDNIGLQIDKVQASTEGANAVKRSFNMEFESKLVSGENEIHAKISLVAKSIAVDARRRGPIMYGGSKSVVSLAIVPILSSTQVMLGGTKEGPPFAELRFRIESPNVNLVEACVAAEIIEVRVVDKSSSSLPKARNNDSVRGKEVGIDMSSGNNKLKACAEWTPSHAHETTIAVEALLQGLSLVSQCHPINDRFDFDFDGILLVIEEAEMVAWFVILVNEICSIICKWEETNGEVQSMIVSQFFTPMDALKPSSHVIVFGTTNCRNSIDATLWFGKSDNGINIVVCDAISQIMSRRKNSFEIKIRNSIGMLHFKQWDLGEQR